MLYKLSSGDMIPAIGLGTYRITGHELIYQVLDYGFQAGYRLIDTAFAYDNEADIGDCLQKLMPKHNLNRSDIFITSKLPPTHHGDKAEIAINTSLSKLKCDYLDLYLIHWPGQGRTARQSDAPARQKSWEVLVKAKHDGRLKNIGVSNYTLHHLKELLSNCFGERPVVNQVEWHPHCHQENLKEFCDREYILIQAYSSLGGTDNNSLLRNKDVMTMAAKYGKSPAQILLRWAHQQDILIIPKGRSQQHIQENFDLNFALEYPDMTLLNNMQQKRFAWDPSGIQ